MTMFTCQHGRTIDSGQKPPVDCENDVRALLNVAKTGTGDQRADALQTLINAPLCVSFSTLHEVTEALVGRPVWTHEFARPEHLCDEARSQQHPADLEAHVIGLANQIMGDEPVIVVREVRHRR